MAQSFGSIQSEAASRQGGGRFPSRHFSIDTSSTKSRDPRPLSLSLSLSLAYSLGHSLSLARSAKPRTIQPRGLDPPPRSGSPPLSFLIRLIRRVERGSSEEEKEEKEEEEEEEDPPRYTTPSRILRVDYVIRSFFRKTDTSLVVQ